MTTLIKGDTLVADVATNSFTVLSAPVNGSFYMADSTQTNGYISKATSDFATAASLGTMSTQSASAVSITGGSITGVTQDGVKITEGSNCYQGVASLTTGTVTVSTNKVAANSRIFLTAQDNNSVGALRVSARTAGTSFTITSSILTDSGDVAWMINQVG